jgi:hypothetical protein
MTQRARRDDVGSCGRDQQAFRQATPLTVLGHPHKPVRLGDPQMVVDLLTRNPQTSSERCRGGRFRQLRKYPPSDGIKRYRRSRRITDDFHFEHVFNLPLTTFIVKGRLKSNSPAVSILVMWFSVPVSQKKKCR